MHLDSATARVPEKLLEFVDRGTIPLCLADAGLADQPLVSVNSRFLSLTGYEAQDVLGHNCRFLQPKEGAGPALERMRDFLQDETQDQAKFVLPNIKADGTPFLNLIYLARLTTRKGRTFFLGSQFDATSGVGAGPTAFDLALQQDIRRLNAMAGEAGFVMLGSYEALANSNSIIARNALDD